MRPAEGFEIYVGLGMRLHDAKRQRLLKEMEVVTTRL
jgi:hypothetical protein